MFLWKDALSYTFSSLKWRGVETDFYSPYKRRQNFKSRLEYWEILSKCERANLTEPCDQIMRIKDGDSRSGGSGGYTSRRRVGK
jgi:hypothetical protein